MARNRTGLISACNYFYPILSGLSVVFGDILAFKL